MWAAHSHQNESWATQVANHWPGIMFNFTSTYIKKKYHKRMFKFSQKSKLLPLFILSNFRKATIISQKQQHLQNLLTASLTAICHILINIYNFILLQCTCALQESHSTTVQKKSIEKL